MLRLKYSFLVASLLFFNILSGQINANFSADTTKGCDLLVNVNFSDQSSGSITSWNWDFGNGSFSQLENPVANYTSTGFYDVKLIVSDGTNIDSVTKQQFIKVYDLPSADFTFSPDSGCSPLQVSFTDNTIEGDTAIDRYIWDYGDGSQAGSAKNPIHTYQNPGSFPTSLQVIDHFGCSDVISKSNVTVINTPTADFTTSNSAVICQNSHTVNFVNNSQGVILSYFWDFGDGQTSTAINPSHTYNGFGRYTVSLIINSIDCSDTLIKNQFVRLEETMAKFTLPKSVFCVNEEISFTNTSTGAINYYWDFGGQDTSTRENPTISFQDSGYYAIHLTATSDISCVHDTIDTIYIQEVVANFNFSPFSVCSRNDTFTFVDNSTNADTLFWYFGLNGNQFYHQKTTSQNTSIKLFENQNYPYENGLFTDSLIAKSRYGCTDNSVRKKQREIRFSVNKIQLIDSLSNIQINNNKAGGCIPLTASFTSSASNNPTFFSFQWDFGNGTTSNLPNPPPVTYLDTNKYVVKLTTINNSVGCRTEDSIIIKGGNPQTPSLTFTKDSVCGFSDKLVINSTSTDASLINYYSYKFNYNEEDEEVIFEGLIPTLTIATHPDTGYTDLNFTITSNGCDSSILIDSAFYVMGPIGGFWYNSLDSACTDRFVDFGSQHLGVTRFKWDFGDGSPINTTTAFPTHQFPNYNTIYKVTFTMFNDSNRCDSVENSKFIEFSDFSNTSIRTNKKNFCIGENLNLNVQSNLNFDRYLWKFGVEEDISTKAASFPISFPGQNPIQLTLNDRMGCAQIFYDTVYAYQPQAKFDTSIISYCLPLEVAFNDQSNSDTAIVKWDWDFGNGSSSIKQNDTIQFSTADTFDIFLKVEDIFGCTNTIRKNEFIAIEEVHIDFESDSTAICKDDQVEFTNTSTTSGLTYVWDFGDGSSAATNSTTVSHTYTSSGRFSVILNAYDADSCLYRKVKNNYVHVEEVSSIDFIADTLKSSCYPLAVNFTDLSEGDINSWKWSFGNGASSTIQDPFINYSTAGNFDVSLKVSTPNGCEDSLTKASYIQTEGPVATIIIDKDSACVNEEVRFIFNSASTISSYSWNFGDGSASTENPATHRYSKVGNIRPSLILTDSNKNCTVVLESEIFIFEVKSGFSLSQDSGCSPLSVTFNKESQGEDAYLWRFGQGSTSTAPNPSFTYSDSGTYQVSLEVSSNTGCEDTAFHFVKVFEKPKAIVSDDLFICEGDTVLLTAEGGDFYEWMPNFSLSDNFGDSILSFPTNNIAYVVYVSTEDDCSDTAFINISVQNSPKPNALEDSIELIIGERYRMDVQAGNEFFYHWSPDFRINCSSCPLVTTQPLKSQNYTVRITDSLGCFNYMDSIFIRVLEKYSLDVPSSFSPNGDGLNDIIFVKGWGLKELVSFKIYNRFGELVFQSTDFNKGWDGTFRGQPQNVETYVYTVEAKTFGNKVLTKRGNINLIR